MQFSLHCKHMTHLFLKVLCFHDQKCTLYPIAGGIRGKKVSHMTGENSVLCEMSQKSIFLKINV